MREKLILLGLLVLFGVFLLRGGITGFAVAEQCYPGNNCQAAGPSIEQPASMSLEDSQALSFIGLLVIVISVALVFGYLRKKPEQEAEKSNQINPPA